MHLNLPTEPKSKKKAPAKYAMSQADKAAFKELLDLALRNQIENYPNTPYPESFLHRYVPNTANGLTRCVIDWLKFSGCQAERISVTGRMVDNTKVVTDIMGSRRVIGSVSYQKSSMVKGSSDISAIIRTKKGIVIPWKIEIKCKATHDRQSEAQKQYEQAVKNAGGHYSIVETLADFSQQWDKIIND